MKASGINAVFYRSPPAVIALCLLFAVIPQMIGITQFISLPSTYSFVCLSACVLGALAGCLFYLPHANNWQQMKGADDAVHIGFKFTERQLMIFASLLFLPLIPDAVAVLVRSQQQSDIRKMLLNDDSIRILNPKLLMALGRINMTLIWFHLVFVSRKTWYFTLLSLAMLAFGTLIWASRTEFILLLVFFIVNHPRIFSKRNVIIGTFAVVISALYTVFVQGRADYVELWSATQYYAVYFGYPLYLLEEIRFVFRDVSLLYSIFGYPVDVVETALMRVPDTIARHLDEIATPSYIGRDVRGFVHESANVLYPHYGFLGLTFGPAGIFLFFMAVTAGICIASVRLPRYLYLWRMLTFVLVWDSLRNFSLGVPNYWMSFVFIIGLCLCFARSHKRDVKANLPLRGLH